MTPETKLITIPATAGNANYTYVNDTKQLMQMAFGLFLVTTDVTVANRYFEAYLLKEDGQFVMDTHAGAPVVASLANQHIELLQGIYRETAFINGKLGVPIPIDFIVPPGWSLQFKMANGVAGDSFSGYAMLMEVGA